MTHSALLDYDPAEHTLFCKGAWNILHLSLLDNNLPSEVTNHAQEELTVDGQQLEFFDSAGALTLWSLLKKIEKKHGSFKLVNFNAQSLKLLKLIEEKDLEYSPPVTYKTSVCYRIGKESVDKLKQAHGFIILLGNIAVQFFYALFHWRYFQWPSIVANIASSGLQALPIVGLLSFLIGIVLSYQMGLQLQTYGANILIAYLSGMAILREFSPLITAIIIAGRTSSAFTAQLGSMKINEEIDAIDTMGLSSVQLLVMPKVLALLFVFPLVIFWSDVFSILGSMMMSKFMLNVGYTDFLNRLRESVGIKQLLLGLYKAPAFALIVSLVGCFQGFRVNGNSASIGTQTTKSVVQALFLIILADAVYSIIYSSLGI